MNRTLPQFIEARRVLCRQCEHAIPAPEHPGKFSDCKITGKRLAAMTNDPATMCPLSPPKWDAMAIPSPAPRFVPAPVVAKPDYRVGSNLKRYLKRIGIEATPNCSCNSRAAQMNAWGADECEKRTEEIVGWLREETERRNQGKVLKLPFIEQAARAIVMRSIHKARKHSK